MPRSTPPIYQRGGAADEFNIRQNLDAFQGVKLLNGLPYYKAYPRDFFEGTRGMGLELKGAYRLLLDLIYMHGGTLEDDARFIAGTLGCSVKKWNLMRAELIKMGKISFSDNSLRNLRADKELEMLRRFQDKQSKNATPSNKNNDLPDAMAAPKVSHTEPEPEEERKKEEQQDAREAVPASPPPENPTDWTPDHLLDEVMAAVGLRSGRIPTHWMPPAATVHVWRWVTDLKLSPDSIIAATRESRKRHREAPTGPKALDGVMTRLAGEIANPPLQPTPGAYAQSTVVPIRKIRAQLPSEVSK